MVERALAVTMTVAAAIVAAALLSPHLITLWANLA